MTCRGEGRQHVRQDDEGHDVTVCAGFGGAKVTGGEFRFELASEEEAARAGSGPPNH